VICLDIFEKTSGFDRVDAIPLPQAPNLTTAQSRPTISKWCRSQQWFSRHQHRRGCQLPGVTKRLINSGLFELLLVF
jgi:hypothetical protein